MPRTTATRAEVVRWLLVVTFGALVLAACDRADVTPGAGATLEATVTPAPSRTVTSTPVPTPTSQAQAVATQEPTAAATTQETPAGPVTPEGAGGPDYIVSKRGSTYYARNSFTGGADFASPSASHIIETVFKALQDPDGTIRNRHILILGSGDFSRAFHLDRRLDFPPMQNTVIDARSVTFVGQGIRIDSVMDGWISLGVVAGRTSGVALDLYPRTVGPDQLIVAIDSQIKVSSIAGSPPPYRPDGVGLRLRATEGDILRLLIDVVNVHGFHTLVERQLAAGRVFMANSLHLRALYEGNTAFGAREPGRGRDSENHYQLAIVGRLGDSGVDIAGRNGTYVLSIVPGATPFGQAVRFVSAATGNAVIAGSGLANLGYTRAAALDNRIFAPGFAASGTATIPAGADSVTVLHGLRVATAIEDIVVTATNDLGDASRFWTGGLTPHGFAIHVDADPGAATATFAWRIDTQ